MGDFDAQLAQTREMIGRVLSTGGPEPIERGAIKRYVEAINDQNPLWVDEEYARSTPLGGTIAPLTFLHQLDHRPIDVTVNVRPTPPITLPLDNPVNGGIAWEFGVPARPGDEISWVTRLGDVVEKQGKQRMILTTVETTYTNQRNEMVGIARHTMIFR